MLLIKERTHMFQSVRALRAVEVSVILRTVSCSNDTSVARRRIGCHQATPTLLDTLCSLPYVTSASGVVEVDTWLLIQSGCSHLTGVGGP